MKRVLHLLWDGALGGTQRYVLRVAGSEFWQNSEHSICLFAEPGDLIHAGLPGLEVRHLGLSGGHDLLKARRLMDICRELAIDTIHCHCDTPAFGLQIQRFADMRLVFSEHGDTLTRQKNRIVTDTIWHHSSRYWHRILLNSQFNYRHFLDIYPRLEAQCQVLPNPLPEICPTIATQSTEGPRRIIAMGRLAPQKGFDRLLHALAALPAEAPDWRLEIYGAGPEEAMLLELRDTLGLNDRVALPGYAASPLEQMAQADLLVAPSRFEAFGLVALEAQSVGLPVVVTEDTGLVEIVRHGETGFIVSQDDDAALTDAILQLLRDRELAARLGAAGRVHALADFSLQRHVQQIEDVYCQS